MEPRKIKRVFIVFIYICYIILYLSCLFEIGFFCFFGDSMGIRNSFNSWGAMVTRQRLQLGPGRWLQQWFHSLAWAPSPSVQNMFKTNPGLSGQENDDFNHWILDGFGLYNPNAPENYTPRNIKPLRPEALPLRSL